jgi:hypothetical protein
VSYEIPKNFEEVYMN